MTIARNSGRDLTMNAKGFVVPPDGGSVLSMAPGRSAALKLLGGETGDSIMLFEETAPAGTDTTFHLPPRQRRGSLRAERRNLLQDRRRIHSRRAGQFLASDESSFVNGSELFVGGGSAQI
jgi:hypothetical protein